jgi:hypothetical protein
MPAMQADEDDGDLQEGGFLDHIDVCTGNPTEARSDILAAGPLPR